MHPPVQVNQIFVAFGVGLPFDTWTWISSPSSFDQKYTMYPLTYGYIISKHSFLFLCKWIPVSSQNAIFLILIIHSKTCVCKSNNTYEKNLLLTKQKKRARAFWRMPSNYLHYLIFFILQLRYASSLLLLALLPSLQQLPSAYHAQSEPWYHLRLYPCQHNSFSGRSLHNALFLSTCRSSYLSRPRQDPSRRWLPDNHP